MTEDSKKDDRLTKWIRWIARIWSAPIIIYALLLLAGYAWDWMTIGTADPYAVDDYPFVEAIPPILLFVSILGLAIAWRWEGLGGFIALGFQIATLFVLAIQRPITGDFYWSVFPYLLTMVVAVPGILFCVCWWRSRRTPPPESGA
jgi:hypothetical protein